MIFDMSRVMMFENVRFELKHKQFHPRVQVQELFQDLEELMAESHLEPIQPIQHEKSRHPDQESRRLDKIEF